MHEKLIECYLISFIVYKNITFSGWWRNVAKIGIGKGCRNSTLVRVSERCKDFNFIFMWTQSKKNIYKYSVFFCNLSTFEICLCSFISCVKQFSSATISASGLSGVMYFWCHWNTTSLRVYIIRSLCGTKFWIIWYSGKRKSCGLCWFMWFN